MDRFDLENAITDLHAIVDHMEEISYGILEENLSREDATNAISGLSVITKIKLEKLFDTFVQVFHLNQDSTAHDTHASEWF